MKYTTASQGGAIAASYPVITAVMARIFLKEKINPLTIFAIFVCTVGVVGNAFFASVGSEALKSGTWKQPRFACYVFFFLLCGLCKKIGW